MQLLYDLNAVLFTDCVAPGRILGAPLIDARYESGRVLFTDYVATGLITGAPFLLGAVIMVAAIAIEQAVLFFHPTLLFTDCVAPG